MSREDLASLIVTDPDIVDEGIDVSGLRTTTDTNPLLLANLEPGIKFDPTQQSVYSDLLSYFSGGLPMIETPTASNVNVPLPGGGDSGGGGTVSATIKESDTGFVNTPEEQRLIDSGIGVQAAPGQPVVAPGEIPVTQQDIDAFNQGEARTILPQTTTPSGDTFAPGDYTDVAGTLADPREKLDFTPEEQSTIQRIIGAAGSDVQNALSELGKIPGAIVDSANKTVKVFGKTLDVGKTIASAAINAAAGFPITLVGQAVGAVLPDRDPRQGALENFYDDQFGLTTAGTIASGVMKGYNPVSGGFLNTITGGKVGDPVNYGLQRTYDKRIEDISGTLADKYGFTDSEIEQVKAGTYTGDKGVMTFDPLGRKTNLIDDLAEIVDLKNKEAAVLDDATDATIGKMFTTLPGADTITPVAGGGNVEDEGEITSDAGFTTVPTGPTLGGSFPGIGVGYETVDDLDEIEGQEAFFKTKTQKALEQSDVGTGVGQPKQEEGSEISFQAKEAVTDYYNTFKNELNQTPTAEELKRIIDNDTDVKIKPSLEQIQNTINTLEQESFLGPGGLPLTADLTGGSGIVDTPDIEDTPILDIPDRDRGQIAPTPPSLDIPDRDRGQIAPSPPSLDIPDRGRGTIAPSPPPRDDDAGMPEAPAPDRGPPTGISGPPSVISRPPSDDGGGGGGGSSKIVCTMMNESYGFGSFRNKIWLRHSKDLAPEYQIGYHKIFLPLVKLSKKNIVLKKVLEHIAVHRTIDIRQESRGKTHMLGRVYRKVLEPICYWVGKYAKR